jgi:hypothetical protein
MFPVSVRSGFNKQNIFNHLPLIIIPKLFLPEVLGNYVGIKLVLSSSSELVNIGEAEFN